MANEWIAKNFFSLPSDTRTVDEANARVLSNAEFYQEKYPDDYVYVLYKDMKRLRDGLVFSNKSYEALLGWGLVSEGDQLSLSDIVAVVQGVIEDQPENGFDQATLDKITDIENFILETTFLTIEDVQKTIADNPTLTVDDVHGIVNATKTELEKLISEYELSEAELNIIKENSEKYINTIVPTTEDITATLTQEMSVNLDENKIAEMIVADMGSDYDPDKIQGVIKALEIIGAYVGMSSSQLNTLLGEY